MIVVLGTPQLTDPRPFPAGMLTVNALMEGLYGRGA